MFYLSMKIKIKIPPSPGRFPPPAPPFFFARNFLTFSHSASPLQCAKLIRGEGKRARKNPPGKARAGRVYV